MKKFKVGTKILKKFQGTWYRGEIESIDVKNRFFCIKYRDGDKEDMDVVDIKNTWIQQNQRERQMN